MQSPDRTEREPQQSFYRLLPPSRPPYPPPRRLPHRKRLLHERLHLGTRSLTTNETTNETDCQRTRTTAIPATRQHLPSHLQPASVSRPAICTFPCSDTPKTTEKPVSRTQNLVSCTNIRSDTPKNAEKPVSRTQNHAFCPSICSDTRKTAEKPVSRAVHSKS